MSDEKKGYGRPMGGPHKPAGESKSESSSPPNGGVVGNTSLKAAVTQLYEEHPHDYDQHGPFHGTADHRVHLPLHGLKPTGKSSGA